MSIPTQVCSKCHEDFMNCKCEQFHPNILTSNNWNIQEGDVELLFHFNIQELTAIYKLVEHMYIPYENQEAHAVIKKIAKIVRENELARLDRSGEK